MALAMPGDAPVKEDLGAAYEEALEAYGTKRAEAVRFFVFLLIICLRYRRADGCPLASIPSAI